MATWPWLIRAGRMKPGKAAYFMIARKQRESDRVLEFMVAHSGL